LIGLLAVGSKLLASTTSLTLALVPRMVCNVLRITMEALTGLELPLIFGATSIGTPGWTPSAGERVAITFLLQGCMS
jgi:hypothetical protein